MASVVGEREIDLTKLSLEQLNQLKTQLSEVCMYIVCVLYVCSLLLRFKSVGT